MRFQIHDTTNGQYMWRLFAANNRIIADSAESYHNKQDCLHAIALMKAAIAAAPVHDVTQSRQEYR